MDLPSSVAPFILRGVSLLGIDSVMCPIELRKQAWARLATDLDSAKLAAITQEIKLEEVVAAGAGVLAGRVRGRIVVRILQKAEARSRLMKCCRSECDGHITKLVLLASLGASGVRSDRI